MLKKFGAQLKILASANAVEDLLIDEKAAKILEPKRSDFIYFRARAISAGDQGPVKGEPNPNGNGDYFPREELEKSYQTFIGRNLFLNHESDHPVKSVGKIIDAYEVDDPETGEYYIECLSKIDKRLHSDIARKVETGELNTVSMGCSCLESICSVCGTTLHTDADERCEHMAPGNLLKEFEASLDSPKFGIAKGQRVKAFCINRGLTFNELSIVNVPADSRAFIKTIIANVRAELTKKASLNKEEQVQLVSHLEQILSQLDEKTRDQVKAEFCEMPSCKTAEQNTPSEKDDVDTILKHLSALQYVRLLEHTEKKAQKYEAAHVEEQAEEHKMKKVFEKAMKTIAGKVFSKAVERIAEEEADENFEIEVDAAGKKTKVPRKKVKPVKKEPKEELPEVVEEVKPSIEKAPEVPVTEEPKVEPVVEAPAAEPVVEAPVVEEMPKVEIEPTKTPEPEVAPAKPVWYSITLPTNIADKLYSYLTGRDFEILSFGSDFSSYLGKLTLDQVEGLKQEISKQVGPEAVKDVEFREFLSREAAIKALASIYKTAANRCAVCNMDFANWFEYNTHMKEKHKQGIPVSKPAEKKADAPDRDVEDMAKDIEYFDRRIWQRLGVTSRTDMEEKNLVPTYEKEMRKALEHFIETSLASDEDLKLVLKQLESDNFHSAYHVLEEVMFENDDSRNTPLDPEKDIPIAHAKFTKVDDLKKSSWALVSKDNKEIITATLEDIWGEELPSQEDWAIAEEYGNELVAFYKENGLAKTAELLGVKAKEEKLDKVVEKSKEELKDEASEAKVGDHLEQAKTKEDQKKEASKEVLASAFDKVEKIVLEEGHYALKDKETQEIVVMNAEGVEVKRLPDGFGDDIPTVMKLLHAVLGLQEKKEEVAPEAPVVEAPVEEPKVEAKASLEKCTLCGKECDKCEGGLCADCILRRKHEKEASEKQAALEIREKELKAREDQIKTQALSEAMKLRIDKCGLIVHAMIDREMLDITVDDLEEAFEPGMPLLDARKKAFEKVSKRQLTSLLAMDDISLEAFAKSVVGIKKEASAPYVTKAFTLQLPPDTEKDDEIKSIFSSMGTLKHQ